MNLSRVLPNIIREGISLRERISYLLQLRKNQWLKRNELEKIQLDRLKAIIRHAYDYIPYYHKLFDSVRFKPKDLKKLEDLKRIPITTKLDIQKNYPAVFIKNADRSRYRSCKTSGSTGIPMEFMYDYKTRHYFEMLLLYNFLECGVKLTDNLLNIERSTSGQLPVIEGARASVSPLFLRLNTAYVNPRLSVDEIVHAINRIKPDVIRCSPNRLEDICVNVKPEINPRLIFSHAGVLTQRVRKIVESSLETKVFDTYGSTEFWLLGSECGEHSGMHMITDSAVVECVKEGEAVASGESGEIVVTGLQNYFMPLIRYELGDIVVPTDESCSCGRGWPLIKVVEGRKNDSFTLPSGRVLSLSEIWQWRHPEIRENIWCFSQYQIVQEAEDKIVFRIVKGKQYNNDITQQIIRKIKRSLEGEDITFTFEIVQKIPKEKSGKRRTIISYV